MTRGFRNQDSGFRASLAALLLSALCLLPSALLGQSANPASIGFPAGVIGTAESATLTTTFTNTSNVTITSMSVSVTTNSAAYSVATSPSTNCGGSLTAGSTCTLTVTYTPQVTGLNAGTITISWSGNGYSPFYVYLSGYGFQGGSAVLSQPIGSYAGATAVTITGTSLTALGGPLTIPAGALNYVGKRLWVHGSGVFTNAATSPLLTVAVSFCTVSGCGSGTVVTPTGLTFVSTADGQTTTNAQFWFDGTFTITSLDTGSGGNGNAKGMGCINLGSATTVAVSCFADTATSTNGTAISLTSVEYIEPEFKFSVSNSSNAATLLEWEAEFEN